MKRILLIGAMIALSACTTSLSATGDSVRVTSNQEAVRGCKYLKTIHHRSLSGGMMFDGSKNAMNKIRNEAAEIGGDIVLLVSETGNNQTGISVTAEVYKSAK